MSFGDPASLLFGLLSLPIIVFYVLRIRLRRVPVSTTLFWERVFEDKRPRALWRRLRHLVSLLVQLLFLFLVVGALADPFLSSAVRDARTIVLVLDDSASMAAHDASGGSTRFDAARAAAREAVQSLRPRDTMAIVTAGTRPRVLCGLTGHQGTLLEALEGASVTAGPTRVTEAVGVARRLLANRENGHVLVIGDGCFEGAADLLAEDGVTFTPAGGPTPNVALTRFQVRRSHADPLGFQVLTEVACHADEPRRCRVEFRLDETLLDVVPVELQPGRTWTHVFEQVSLRGGVLTARVESDDAQPLDDVARAVLPGRSVRPVRLVEPRNAFLSDAFAAQQPLVELLPAGAPATPAGTLTVHYGKIPANIPAGPVLIVAPANSCDLFTVGKAIEDPIVARQDEQAVIMRHVRLQNVDMPDARVITLKAPAHVEAESLEGAPLLFTLERPAGRVLVLNADLDDGDLALRTAFPILVGNALDWYAGTPDHFAGALVAGEVRSVALPAELLERQAPPTLVDPGGRRAALAPDARGRVSVGPLDRAGLWRVEAGDAVLSLAVNPSPDEGDLRPPAGLRPTTLADGGLGGEPLWVYLVVIALLLSTVEWWLHQRRRLS